MYCYKTFEVRYCVSCKENIVFEIIHKEDGSKIYTCLSKEQCKHGCEFPKGKSMDLNRVYFNR